VFLLRPRPVRGPKKLLEKRSSRLGVCDLQSAVRQRLRLAWASWTVLLVCVDHDDNHANQDNQMISNFPT
jgi:hypothetical protein